MYNQIRLCVTLKEVSSHSRYLYLPLHHRQHQVRLVAKLYKLLESSKATLKVNSTNKMSTMKKCCFLSFLFSPWLINEQRPGEMACLHDRTIDPSTRFTLIKCEHKFGFTLLTDIHRKHIFITEIKSRRWSHNHVLPLQSRNLFL